MRSIVSRQFCLSYKFVGFTGRGLKGRPSPGVKKSSDTRFPSFACSYPDDLLKGKDKDLSVTDLSRLRLFLYRRNDFLRHTIGYHYLQLHLWDKGDVILRSPVKLDVPFLPA